MRTAVPLTDQVTGLYAALSIMGALFKRATTGVGEHVDMAMIDCATAIVSAVGGLVPQWPAGAARGQRQSIAAPSELFQTLDGKMIIASGNDGQWAAICKALGIEHLIDDPRLNSLAARVEHRELCHRNRRGHSSSSSCRRDRRIEQGGCALRPDQRHRAVLQRPSRPRADGTQGGAPGRG